MVIALCSKSSSISETPSHVAAGHYWPAIPSSQNSLSSSSSSSSSSSLVYHPLRKGSRREMRTPSFISISQAVECCKGIQNFFFFFFFFFLLLLALCLSSLLAASVGSGLSIEVTIRWLAVTVRTPSSTSHFVRSCVSCFRRTLFHFSATAEPTNGT